MKVKVFDEDFSEKEIEMEISICQRIVLAINKYVFVFYGYIRGRVDSETYYIVRCSSCKKLFLDYSHTHGGRFYCPRHEDSKIDKEMKKLMKNEF